MDTDSRINLAIYYSAFSKKLQKKVKIEVTGTKKRSF